MPKMSIKGLAKYMVSTPSQQRKVIRDYKFPKGEGMAQVNYYRDVKAAIKEYHRAIRPVAWLESKAELFYRAAASETGSKKTKTQNNARSMREYADNFSEKSYRILAQKKFKFSHSGMTITLTPDLCVSEKGRNKFIFFDFSKKKTDVMVHRIMAQCLFDAIRGEGISVSSREVQILDVARGDTIFGAQLSSRTRGEIEAACATINTLWPSIGLG